MIGGTKQRMIDHVLTEVHRNAGLRLEESEDFVELWEHEAGKPIAVWHSKSATFASILHEADQYMEWMKSGISFTRRD